MASRIHAQRSRSHPDGVIASMIIATTLITGAALFHTWVRLQTISLGYQLSSAAAEKTILSRSNRELNIESATLRAPKRLTMLARTTLGLRPPEPGEIIVLRPPKPRRDTTQQNLALLVTPDTRREP